MTKMEMVKELIEYGVIAEADKAHVMKMAKARIERIYKEVLPIRKAYLEGKGWKAFFLFSKVSKRKRPRSGREIISHTNVVCQG